MAEEKADGTGGQGLGAEFGPLVDEVRKFALALGGKAQQYTVRLREENPEVYGHLAAAGGELVAAYRAAVSGHERRWAGAGHAEAEHIDLDKATDN
ncbi:DUF5304 family protein [Kitasatospora sp. NPDC085879]|uniref:DUF5304 family protein n=1 Tax=Kitasatospora sp. NPDC085879 TaxID=3154769 RepID=UPI000BB0FE4F|nr:DUF5304 family protein [Streptomyces sp. TLI_235]PBC72036.1 hypothetical protein BX265_6652 [Streptomyces sp. TLI_235]